MRKLMYKIFNNLSDEDYFELKDRLVPIKILMERVLLPHGWLLNDSEKLNEALSVAFSNFDDGFEGGLGLSFDQTDSKEFSFGIIKTIDVAATRYYKSAVIVGGKPLSYFEQEVLIGCVDAAIDLYKTWSKEYIIESGENIKMP